MTKWSVLLVIVCVLYDIHQFLSYAEAHPKLKFWQHYCLEDTRSTDDPDPVTGLTSRDIYLVRSSYKTVRKNPLKNGMALLNLLFKNHPETLQLFSFRNIPLEELPNNRKYLACCKNVMNGFSEIIDAIDNVDLLIPILNKVGKVHQRRKVTEKSFLQLKDTVIELFSTFMKPVEIEAWQKTLDVTFSIINRAVRETAAQKYEVM